MFSSDLALTLYLSICLVFISCQNSNTTEDLAIDKGRQNLTILEWRDSVVNLGTVRKNLNYPIVFYVKNIGENPLLFTKIESTCGCTVLEKIVNSPILPSKNDSIVGHFKLNDAAGFIERKVYILANTQQQFYVLRIKANVIE